MKITPLDIRQKRFASAFRGFHSREVEGYLELLAAEFEEVVKENVALKEELKRTQARLEQHVERASRCVPGGECPHKAAGLHRALDAAAEFEKAPAGELRHVLLRQSGERGDDGQRGFDALDHGAV